MKECNEISRHGMAVVFMSPLQPQLPARGCTRPSQRAQSTFQQVDSLIRLSELQNKQSKAWFSTCIERQRQADLLILRPAWSALQFQVSPGLHSVSLSRKAEGYVCAERWKSSSEHSLFLEDPRLVPSTHMVARNHL